ncbi:BTB/POZ domain and ankyrin repeat-containing protein COCH [Argentina anserina]|uniref:BTB/POZ domain and ankyrin repeat-containing protein COCH n=1 Tax=Argentina anserina TaxID=57926 RepID=UPI002176823D|nr:BTB/POZ domain and ankyrin repeat-containing protein COCH [Potentilla anserina]
MSSLEDSLRSLSLDYLNLLINGQAFSDVTFSVEGRLVHAHRCILAARSLFFRKFFCGPDPPSGLDPMSSPGSCRSGTSSSSTSQRGMSSSQVIPVNSVGYEVFLLLLQFLYSGQVSIVPQKHEPRPDCGERGCWHTHCTSAVDLALDTLAAARSFGVDQLALLTQKQLASMVEKASIDDVMKVLLASRKQDMHQLWTTCSHLVAKSGLPPEVLAKHLPIDVVAKIEELRLKSSIARRSMMPHHHHHHHHHDMGAAADLEDQKIRRMRRALDSSDVELVKLMVMGEGLNLDEALALHYAVESCSREVVKALLELGAADVNYPAGPAGKTPLHIASEMVSPDMVAVLLDHHADPNVRTVDGVTPLDVLRTLTSDFLFKGAVPGLTHIEPNKLRLCLELVQSAALVLSREEGNNNANNSASNSSNTAIYPPMSDHHDHHSTGSGGSNISLNLDSRLVYLNLGATGSSTAQNQMGSSRMDGEDHHQHHHSHGRQGGCDPSTMYHHSHDF